MSGPLQPPANEKPIADDGVHTVAWLAHFQEVTDAINGMPIAVRKGVTNGSAAAAGEIGERLTAAGGLIGIANNTPTNIASIPLTAGDWDVSGRVEFIAAGTTHPTQIGAAISTVSATLQQAATLIGAAFTVGAAMAIGTAGSAEVNVNVVNPTR